MVKVRVAALVDGLVVEILLRFPPDDPAALVRATLVCKCWRRLVSGVGFRRRFCEFHTTAPLLGFLRDRGSRFHFQPTTSSFRPRFPLAVEHSGAICRAVDARHGRVLIHRYFFSEVDLFVWNPITGSLRRLPRPRILLSCHNSWTAAFVCAAAGCDHLGCAAGGGPFRVVFVGTEWGSPPLTSVYVYSSEGGWSDQPTTTVQHTYPIAGSRQTAMVGNALYFLFQRRSGILKHDLDIHISCVEQTPACIKGKRVLLTATEDGRLGFAMIRKSELPFRSRGADNDGWAQNRVIELRTLLPGSSDALTHPPKLVAFAGGIGVTVIVQTGDDALFAVDLKSSHVREIGKSLKKLHSYGVVPFVSFCTPCMS